MLVHQYAGKEGEKFRVDYRYLDETDSKAQTLIGLAGAPILRAYPGYFNRERANQLYNSLDAECQWSIGKVRMGSRLLDEPRESMLCAAENAPQYTYSGVQKTVHPFNSTTRDIISDIAARGEFQAIPTAILINKYSPSQYIGEHSDDEKSLNQAHPIFSLSLGQKRVLVIREKKKCYSKYSQERRKWRLEIPMEHGDLLEFCPGMQSWFSHELIKPRKNELEELARAEFGARINMTFRVMNQ